MISTVIAMLLIATLYSCWSAMVNVTHTGTAAAQAAHRERLAMQAIQDTLAGAAWFQDHSTFPVMLTEENGASRLSVVTRVPPDFWGQRELGDYPLRQVEFFTEPNGNGELQLVMTQRPMLATNATERLVRTVLLPTAEEFFIQVQADQPDVKNEWLSLWPETNRYANLLPRQADISLGSHAHIPFHRIVPVYASMANRAGQPPGIGITTNLAGVTFGEGGFDLGDNDSNARVIFLIDKSGSMYGERLATAKFALMNTLGKMDPAGKFYVIFFNRDSDPMPSSSMLEATPDNIARMKKWIDSRKPSGGTNPSDALTAAFLQQPTELYLLTDGEFRRRRDEPAVRDLINTLNTGKKAKVHTLALGNDLSGKVGETMLMVIAKENGGTFTHINTQVADPPAVPPTVTPNP